MDDAMRSETIEEMMPILIGNYDTKKLLSYVYNILTKLSHQELSDTDTGYTYLAKGNVNILEGKEGEISIKNFSTASEFSMTEGLLQAGSSLEEIGKYDEAMQYFEQAFCQEDTILVITKLLHCALQAEQFDTAQKYINHALSKRYDIHNYILAFHLGQGHTKEALLQMISIIIQKQALLDTPE